MRAPAELPTVLIADDDPDVLELVRLSLRPADLELVLAHDGAEALATALRIRPALAILDVTMPEMDGFEVTEAIRADPTVSSTRIFLLTARARQVERERGLALGADRYLAKPFKPRELRAEVDAALARDDAGELPTDGS
jgi:two-component system alkaline phosphatase synthesis response regulator PhoP